MYLSKCNSNIAARARARRLNSTSHHTPRYRPQIVNANRFAFPSTPFSAESWNFLRDRSPQNFAVVLGVTPLRFWCHLFGSLSETADRKRKIYSLSAPTNCFRSVFYFFKSDRLTNHSETLRTFLASAIIADRKIILALKYYALTYSLPIS